MSSMLGPRCSSSNLLDVYLSNSILVGSHFSVSSIWGSSIRSYFYGSILVQYAAREAEIVAQAGRKYAITISTNMAGRGTDIILGGNPKVGILCCNCDIRVLRREYFRG